MKQAEIQVIFFTFIERLANSTDQIGTEQWMTCSGKITEPGITQIQKQNEIQKDFYMIKGANIDSTVQLTVAYQMNVLTKMKKMKTNFWAKHSENFEKRRGVYVCVCQC